jgi:hypothetical protein
VQGCPEASCAMLKGDYRREGPTSLTTALERGHEVAIVDDLSSGKRENVADGTRFYKVDVRSGCKEVFEDFKPEAFCPQAAQMDVRRSVKEPHFDADVNILGTIRLLQACVQHGLGKVVFASTGGLSTASNASPRPQRTTRSTPPLPLTGSQGLPPSATSTTTTLNTTCCRTSRCATQRLRAQARPAREGGGGRDILWEPDRRVVLKDQRQWGTDPRLRLRRDRRALQSPRA